MENALQLADWFHIRCSSKKSGHPVFVAALKQWQCTRCKSAWNCDEDQFLVYLQRTVFEVRKDEDDPLVPGPV
jgi:hypothetical protein